MTHREDGSTGTWWTRFRCSNRRISNFRRYRENKHGMSSRETPHTKRYDTYSSSYDGGYPFWDELVACQGIVFLARIRHFSILAFQYQQIISLYDIFSTSQFYYLDTPLQGPQKNILYYDLYWGICERCWYLFYIYIFSVTTKSVSLYDWIDRSWSHYRICSIFYSYSFESKTSL